MIGHAPKLEEKDYQIGRVEGLLLLRDLILQPQQFFTSNRTQGLESKQDGFITIKGTV